MMVLLLRTVAEMKDKKISQRALADSIGVSLGKGNALIKEAINKGLLSAEEGGYGITGKGLEYLEPYKVDNAIILAAGFGSRFVPFTYETPKGLLKVKGQPMIERQVEQLNEAGIKEVIIVVGYLKEKFDYLVDKYGVKLVYNPEYANKNNFVSLYLTREYMRNTYVLFGDNWMSKNVFHAWEPYSWVSCNYYEGATKEWAVTVGAHGRVKKVDTLGGCATWSWIGPALFMKEESDRIKPLLEQTYKTPGKDGYFYENIIVENLKDLELYANYQEKDVVYEFESLEEIRMFDPAYIDTTGNVLMEEIAKVFSVSESDIIGIAPLKDGLTNTSFVFQIKGSGQRYVFRKPGIGTEKLINRKNEKLVYDLLPPGIADEVVYFDAQTGHRITKFWENVRVADPYNDDDLKISMRIARNVHDLCLKVDHEFDLRNMIDYYKDLCQQTNAILFTDIETVTGYADELLSFRDKLNIPKILCNSDFAHVNAIIFPDGSARLIDWEYSGMSDPITDIALYGLYACFDKDRFDLSLRYYCGREPADEEYTRLYLYIALGGFWASLWAQYKQAQGQELGEYPLAMYRYMKDYYHMLKNGNYLN